MEAALSDILAITVSKDLPYIPIMIESDKFFSLFTPTEPVSFQNLRYLM